MAWLSDFFYYLFHIDSYLVAVVSAYGGLAYAVLFAIIFCETGLIIVPFLPGDSLLFAAGSLSAQEGQPLNMQLLLVLLVSAAVLGNKANYLVGRAIGPRIFSARASWFFHKRYLEKAHAFYAQHGGKALIISRFLPIVRTFVPFIAGVSEMKLRDFTFYNLLSAILWVGGLLGIGHWFGQLPLVQRHFSVALYGVIGVSLLPGLLLFAYRKWRPSS